MKTPALLFFLAAFAVVVFPSFSKDDEENSDEKSFGDIVANCDLADGLFNLYTDRDDGTVYLAVRNEQLGPEFIHFSHIMDGVAELGLFRGNFLNEKIFTVRKHYDRIEFVAQNTAFYFDPENAISKAANANISEAVLASEKIVATTEDKTTHLIKASNLFLNEQFSQLKSAGDDDDDDRLKLGDLSEDRTRFSELRNYPQNTLARVNYVFENKRPKKWGEDDVTDARYITISVQHSLIAVPDNDFRQRFEDPRVGYFTTRVTDLTSKASANYRDLIHRWHLKKKDPSAAVSDPVEPITWWMEKTTPVELRETIKGAVEAWNLAFASAGFSNAVVCKMQPDDAEWDAGDIRYNVLRWTSSPDPPFGGYGPSFVNPRTGQIMGSDIMLEYVFLTNRIRLRELLQKTSNDASGALPPVKMNGQFPFNRMDNLGRPRDGRGAFCQAGNFMQDNAIAARASLAVAGASKIEVDALIKEALYDLVLHEVGHTLGLNHNFIASQMLKPEELHNKEITGKRGVIASVMDYTPANISTDREKQGHYYSTVPGPYDHWAIRFGYSESTPETESAVLDAILVESTKPEHAFGNDADDMRYPGNGIDPRIMINDLSSDPIAHAIETIERARKTIGGLAKTFPQKGETYHEMRTAFSSIMRDYERAAATLSRYIGGVKIDRSTHGQAGAAAAPYLPIPAAEQKRAAAALEKYVFGPDAFTFFPADLIGQLQLQRRGFEFSDLDANEDPKVHAAVSEIQRSALNHLLHKNTLRRLVDSTLYGNEFTISDAMTTLDTAIMAGDRDTFREALQVDYIHRLIKISGLTDDSASGYESHARSQAVFLLEKNLPGAAGNAHEAYLRRVISNAMNGRG